MTLNNPFKMKEMSPEGPYILGDEQCTDIKIEYLRRGNTILASYATVATMSNIGLQRVKEQIKDEETPMRLTLGSRLIQCKFRTLNYLFPIVTRQLTNQGIIIVYGNFEAYLVDILISAFQELKIENPEQETLNMLAARGWEGKIDHIGQKLKVNIGKRQFLEKFKDIPLDFQGTLCKDPIIFLQKVADVRHLIAHSSGRISEGLAKAYPGAGLKTGDVIQLPVELPFDLHIFLVAFTDVFDKAFSEKYGWERKTVSPESLV